MIDCDDAVLQQWHPDFSSSQQEDPSWTRVTCREVLLCNALEWVHWLENPVQVVLCEACGYAGCTNGGYAHISRLGDHILWTRPQINQSDDWERGQYQPAWPLRRFGAVIIALHTWAQWQDQVSDLPSAEQMVAATGRELIDAWLLGARGEHRVASANELMPSLRGRVLASDLLDADAAVDRVADVLADLSSLGEGPVSGRIARAAEVGARPDVLYFDGPGEEDWPALAFIGSRIVPAFSREWVFVS